MKKHLTIGYFLILSFLGVQFASSAQFIEPPFSKPPKFYLGLGTGIDYFTGLIGPSFECQVAKNFTVYGGVGLGSWGYKISGGARYYIDYPKKWAFSAGISHATGLKNFEFEMETTSSTSEKVMLDLNPVNTINLSALYFIKLGKKSRMNFEFGYAIPITDNYYSIKNGVTLTDESETLMQILQPGGIILGLGFSFGI